MLKLLINFIEFLAGVLAGFSAAKFAEARTLDESARKLISKSDAVAEEARKAGALSANIKGLLN